MARRTPSQNITILLGGLITGLLTLGLVFSPLPPQLVGMAPLVFAAFMLYFLVFRDVRKQSTRTLLSLMALAMSYLMVWLTDIILTLEQTTSNFWVGNTLVVVISAAAFIVAVYVTSDIAKLLGKKAF